MCFSQCRSFLWSSLELFFTLKVTIGLIGSIFGLVSALAVVFLGSNMIRNKLSASLIRKVMKGVDVQFSPIRRELFKNVRGKILDVGCGGGDYFKYYVASSRVTELVAIEPNIFLHTTIHEKLATLKPQFPCTVTHELIDKIQGDGTFDFIVLGNVLCEVPSQADALKHVNRLLKKGGHVYFSEHVWFDSSLGRMFQNFVNPLWCLLSGGCNCNRNTMASLKAQPWDVVSWEFRDLAPFPWIGPMLVGLCQKK